MGRAARCSGDRRDGANRLLVFNRQLSTITAALRGGGFFGGTAKNQRRHESHHRREEPQRREGRKDIAHEDIAVHHRGTETTERTEVFNANRPVVPNPGIGDSRFNGPSVETRRLARRSPGPQVVPPARPPGLDDVRTNLKRAGLTPPPLQKEKGERKNASVTQTEPPPTPILCFLCVSVPLWFNCDASRSLRLCGSTLRWCGVLYGGFGLSPTSPSQAEHPRRSPVPACGLSTRSLQRAP